MKTVTLRLPEEVYRKFKTIADRDHRAISNFIETATLRYIEQSVEYVSDLEMEDLAKDKPLLSSLKRGSKDAKSGRGNSLSNYKVFATAEFSKGLAAFDGSIRESLRIKINEYVLPQLISAPQYGLNIKKLRGYTPETWRYRIAHYRLFYEVDEEQKIVSLISISNRKNAYE